MKSRLPLVFTCISLCFGTAWADVESSDFFEAKIRPVLVTHCYKCHSTESGKAKGGLRLDSRRGWEVGGDSGPAIAPGRPDRSLLLAAIDHTGATAKMPPKSRLSDQVVGDFRRWIAEGAFDPREGAAAAREEAIDIEEGR
ncbi:MAG: c-type cytochrome domain-containing protein, partial [Planctomycetota bacterium]